MNKHKILIAIHDRDSDKFYAVPHHRKNDIKKIMLDQLMDEPYKTIKNISKESLKVTDPKILCQEFEKNGKNILLLEYSRNLSRLVDTKEYDRQRLIEQFHKARFNAERNYHRVKNTYQKYKKYYSIRFNPIKKRLINSHQKKKETYNTIKNITKNVENGNIALNIEYLIINKNRPAYILQQQ